MGLICSSFQIEGGEAPAPTATEGGEEEQASAAPAEEGTEGTESGEKAEEEAAPAEETPAEAEAPAGDEEEAAQ